MTSKTKDQRIHVTFDDSTREILGMIAKKENRSLSEVVRRKVEDWLENYEDEYWAGLVAGEDTGETIPAEEVWKNVQN
jgi:predicted transcriptional regulator